MSGVNLKMFLLQPPSAEITESILPWPDSMQFSHVQTCLQHAEHLTDAHRLLTIPLPLGAGG